MWSPQVCSLHKLWDNNCIKSMYKIDYVGLDFNYKTLNSTLTYVSFKFPNIQWSQFLYHNFYYNFNVISCEW